MSIESLTEQIDRLRKMKNTKRPYFTGCGDVDRYDKENKETLGTVIEALEALLSEYGELLKKSSSEAFHPSSSPMHQSGDRAVVSQSS